jgi:hypothetical protein
MTGLHLGDLLRESGDGLAMVREAIVATAASREPASSMLCARMYFRNFGPTFTFLTKSRSVLV